MKVLRPGMQAAIDKDLRAAAPAGALGRAAVGRRQAAEPREVVAEFDGYLHDELDLMREAANASQLRRNMAGSRGARAGDVWDCAPATSS